MRFALKSLRAILININSYLVGQRCSNFLEVKNTCVLFQLCNFSMSSVGYTLKNNPKLVNLELDSTQNVLEFITANMVQKSNDLGNYSVWIETNYYYYTHVQL